MEIKELAGLLQNSGVVGAGGAGFPTYAKLDARAETIIMNCAECEPLLKLHRQLLEKYADEIVSTFHLVMETVGAKEAIIGIKKAYKAAIKAIEGVISRYPPADRGLRRRMSHERTKESLVCDHSGDIELRVVYGVSACLCGGR